VSRSLVKFALYLSLIALFAACYPPAESTAERHLVATNSIIADVVSQVAGDLADVRVLVASGTDPHAYEPSPQDIAAVADADLVFSNGLGLEGYLDGLIANAGGVARLVDLSAGVDTLSAEEVNDHVEEGDLEVEADQEGGGQDPHVWTNPLNVIVWADHIATMLAEIDSANAEAYQSNARAYVAELEALDAWALEQIAQIPVERRLLVTDHEVFCYFADHYGFEVVGAVIPGTSTVSESSATQIGALHDLIEQHGVSAIFVGFTINEAVAERIAEDGNAQLVPLYSESLGEPGGPADSYIDMFRYNVEAIVDALVVE
jgi:ABC-type Zn uptake system ZnuABC Zn-binding protein ZnuA